MEYTNQEKYLPKRKYIYLFFGVAFIFILIITNPSELNHRDKVKFKINQLLQNNVGNNPLKAIGIIVGGLVTDKFVNSSVTSKNFVLFSLTQFSWNGDTKTIGFGMMGSYLILRSQKSADFHFVANLFK